jgi:similar to stage IV sporulation protein
MPKQEDKAPAHIMAGKDGVITEIIAVTGQPAVKKGDTVKKGDLLIKGFAEEAVVPTVPGQPPIISVPLQLIKAQGIVKARVWYESYGEAYLMQSYHERTGNQLSEINVLVENNQFCLKKAPAKP